MSSSLPAIHAGKYVDTATPRSHVVQFPTMDACARWRKAIQSLSSVEECPHKLTLEDKEWESLDWIVLLLQSIDMPRAQTGIESLIKVRDYCHDAHNTIHDLEDQLGSFVNIVNSSIPANARNN